MTTVVISPSNVVTFPEGGGHFWVYMQYVQGFLKQGCEVYWLERFSTSGDNKRDEQMLSLFFQRMDQYDLNGKVILYTIDDSVDSPDRPYAFINVETSVAESIIQQADLLLNFHYAMHPHLLSRFRRTALVDIDPGLLQFWISTEQLR